MGAFNEYLVNTDLTPLMKIFTEYGECIYYTKGEYFLREGDKSFYIGFIQCGVFKYEKVDSSGVLHTVGFNLDNDFVCDYTSFLRCENSYTTIVAVCDCKVYRLSYKKLMTILGEDMQAKEVWLKGCEGFAITMYNRLLDFYCKTPMERYVILLERFPDIVHYVPLKEIASFIGVKAETLSRIRRKLEKNGRS